jgi:hypothetical protein
MTELLPPRTCRAQPSLNLAKILANYGLPHPAQGSDVIIAEGAQAGFGINLSC